MRYVTLLFLFISLPLLPQKDQNSRLRAYLNKALDVDSANHYFDKAKSVINSNDQEGVYHYYLMIHQTNHGDLDSAEHHGLLALEYIPDSNKQDRKEVFHRLMIINRDKGLLDKALEYCLEAYHLVVSMNDTAQIARYLTERAFIHHDFEQYELGIRSGKQALQVWKNHSRAINLHQLYILNSIAINFDDWNKPDSALAYYDKILAIKSLKGSAELGPIYNNQGNTLLKQERYREAYQSLMKSYKIQKKSIGDYHHYDLATVLNNLGIIQSHFNHWDSSRYYLKLAEMYADSSNSFEKKRDSYLAQYQIAEKQGELRKALDYQSKYYLIKDSIFQKDRAEVIARMETEYETEKKEQQLALQDAELAEQKAELIQNRILLFASTLLLILLLIIGLLWRNRVKKKQLLAIQQEKLKAKEAEINATISSLENERARYARDLHDGFGQMISILNMNLKSLIEGSKPNDRQKVFEESSKVIDEMYEELKNICFDLMPQTLIKYGLESGLQEFIERINHSGKLSIELNVFGLEKRLSEIQEISLYRISQEWINNIIKYSSAQIITLQITKDDDEITLLIEDDGAGFDKNLLLAGDGNGWKNLNTRASLINGALELETQTGIKGNTLIVNAPATLEPSDIKSLDQNTIKVV
ncbi:tetratricopeptide repeat-containing sensor histidine kinase [Ekhidna sp.]|uniref:tetratricopeptide repeat-containing sensor histidine kinase n=1 Tax=Ekhidna sp. TaxID=2608089 RepID=UPI003C7A4276